MGDKVLIPGLHLSFALNFHEVTYELLHRENHVEKFMCSQVLWIWVCTSYNIIQQLLSI